MANPTEFLRLALDATRLAVLGHAAAGPVDVDALAGLLDEPKKKVQLAVVRLQEAGLLADDTSLDRQALADLGAALPQMEPVADEIIEGPWTAEETEVLRRFFEGSRLKQIPSQQGKRRIVLERIAQQFDPGVQYPERQVNFIIQLIYHDFAAIRRYLVDEELMTRAEGVYWRTGGRYDGSG